jgi:DNA-binding NtrC family response regulator
MIESIPSRASECACSSGGFETPVLIVDDEDEVRELLVQMLAALGYNPAGACGAREAIEYLRENRPGLALVDLFLADGSGIDVLEAARERYPDLPVVMISGAGGSLSDLLRNHQPSALLTKPFTLGELRNLVRQLQPAEEWRGSPAGG